MIRVVVSCKLLFFSFRTPGKVSWGSVSREIHVERYKWLTGGGLLVGSVTLVLTVQIDLGCWLTLVDSGGGFFFQRVLWPNGRPCSFPLWRSARLATYIGNIGVVGHAW